MGMNFRPSPKPAKPQRGDLLARQYMSLAATLPCLCCGKHPVDLHHARMGRYSQGRSSDYHVLPICRRHHMELEMQRLQWITAYGLDIDYVPATRHAVVRIIRDTVGGRYDKLLEKLEGMT